MTKPKAPTKATAAAPTSTTRAARATVRLTYRDMAHGGRTATEDIPKADAHARLVELRRKGIRAHVS